MSDLVNELRQGSLNKDDYRWRAAARIEQLEAALREISDCKTFTDRKYMIDLARAALGEERT